MSTLETLQHLVEHSRLGREEVAQRLLTGLALGDRYPPYDQRSTPSPAGVEFRRGHEKVGRAIEIRALREAHRSGQRKLVDGVRTVQSAIPRLEGGNVSATPANA